MEPRDDLPRIALASLASVDPQTIVARNMRISGGTLHAGTGDAAGDFDLSRFHRVLVLGFGKAAGPMARAVEQALGPRIDEGLIVVKRGHEVPLERIRTTPGGHPCPMKTACARPA